MISVILMFDSFNFSNVISIEFDSKLVRLSQKFGNFIDTHFIIKIIEPKVMYLIPLTL